jgi:hypothetical protein
MEGEDALQEGEPGRALGAMERALNWLRSREERERAAKGSKTLREAAKRGEEEEDPGENSGEGAFPGRGRSPHAKGKPTPRLRGAGVAKRLEGESGEGRREAFNTRLADRASRRLSQLPYDSTLLSHYRKIMEETLAKESIPFEHREQIRDYFRSLEEP